MQTIRTRLSFGRIALQTKVKKRSRHFRTARIREKVGRLRAGRTVARSLYSVAHSTSSARTGERISGALTIPRPANEPNFSRWILSRRGNKAFAASISRLSDYPRALTRAGLPAGREDRNNFLSLCVSPST
ncbi:hypothetical protein PUN28_008426 [Cardiocondyla obscurior]|uniref:Ribosomal protein L20 n=1 Tax=Cardiocondyla obscurior TaxID=286306 RepID=A0AAW2FXQ4_9HYME